MRRETHPGETPYRRATSAWDRPSRATAVITNRALDTPVSERPRVASVLRTPCLRSWGQTAALPDAPPPPASVTPSWTGSRPGPVGGLRPALTPSAGAVDARAAGRGWHRPHPTGRP